MQPSPSTFTRYYKCLQVISQNLLQQLKALAVSCCRKRCSGCYSFAENWKWRYAD